MKQSKKKSIPSTLDEISVSELLSRTTAQFSTDCIVPLSELSTIIKSENNRPIFPPRIFKTIKALRVKLEQLNTQINPSFFLIF